MNGLINIYGWVSAVGFPICLMHLLDRLGKEDRRAYSTGHDDGWNQGWDEGWDDCRDEIAKRLEQHIDGSDVRDDQLNDFLIKTIQMIRTIHETEEVTFGTQALDS